MGMEFFPIFLCDALLIYLREIARKKKKYKFSICHSKQFELIAVFFFPFAALPLYAVARKNAL
jgi:hypothetical protein